MPAAARLCFWSPNGLNKSSDNLTIRHKLFSILSSLREVDVYLKRKLKALKRPASGQVAAPLLRKIREAFLGKPKTNKTRKMERLEFQLKKVGQIYMKKCLESGLIGPGLSHRQMSECETAGILKSDPAGRHCRSTHRHYRTSAVL